MEQSILLICLLAIVPLEGFTLAITPWVQRRNECFAVTVPPSAQNQGKLRGLKVRYTIIMAAITLVCTAIVGLALFGGNDLSTQEGSMMLVVALLIGCLLPCLLSFLLMLLFRKMVRSIKWEEGWVSTESVVAAAVSEEDIPKPLPLAVNLIYLPIIAVTALLTVAWYPAMPDMIPMNVDFSGNVNNWVPKSPLSASFPLVLEVFLAVVFAFCHWSMIRSKKHVDPSAPVSSAYGYGAFLRAQSVLLVVSGLLVTAACGGLFLLSSMRMVTLELAAAAILLVAMVIVVGSVIIMVKYGQAGSKVAPVAKGENDMRFDDDARWILGVFYFNPKDSSLFLPKRFGVGWTANFARPAVWLIILGFVVLLVALLLFSLKLAM